MRRSASVLLGVAIAGLLLVLGLAPVIGAHALPAAATLGGPRPFGAAASSDLTGRVTWNGNDVATAATMSSALSTNFGSTVDLHYVWSSGGAGSGAGALYNISDARLQMFYFGFALATRDVLDSTPVAADNGTFDMTWSPGVLQWLLAGTFGLTASLLAPNGTTEWSQNFFVHVTAPASIGAVIPILLIIIGIYEFYALAMSGRQAAMSAPSAGPSSASPSTRASSSPPPAAATPASTPTSPATDAATSESDAAPPTEGT
jgi:hypothetical protein